MSAKAQATIRRARPDDLEQLAETAVAAWREGFRGLVPDWVDPRRAWRPARIAERLAGTSDDDGVILCAEIEGVVRGLILVGPSRDQAPSPGEGEIVALYVHPDHWRRGVGQALVAAGLEQLAAAGHSQAIVWTLAESPRNLRFYEALGFRRDGGKQRRPSFGSPPEVRLRRLLTDQPEGPATER